MDIFEDFLIDEDFDEDFYEKNYPDVRDYFLSSGVAKRKRLFHHYLNHGKNLYKNENQLEKALFGEDFIVDEDFDEDFYEKIVPGITEYFLPAASSLRKKSRFYHHYITYNKKEKIYLPKKPKIKIKQTSKHEGPKINCKILIKIPSLERPKNLLYCLDCFQKNAKNLNEICFCISANSNDSETNNKELIEKLNSFSNCYIFFNDHDNKIEAYNADIDKFNFEILIAASDDMEVICKNYDEVIVSYMNKYFPDGDGVLWFDTGDSEITDTLSILGKKYYDRFGYLYNKIYSAYYCDDEFTQVAFKLGKLLRIKKQIIKHNILSHLDMSKENTYLKSLVFGSRDKALYKVRKNIQFDVAGSNLIDNPFYHKFSDCFFEEKRNKQNNWWRTHFTKFDDPISPCELYILEGMDRTVSDMTTEQFICFAKNYFRNFRLLVPPIIHQIWFGEITDEIRLMMETFSKSYIEKHPGWRYILWDEKRLENLDMINRDIFYKQQKYDSKSDIARLEILNRFGGWYLDSDFVWLGKKSLFELTNLINNGFAVAYEKEGKKIGRGYLDADTTRVANGFMCSTIANPIIAFIIGKLKNSYASNCKKGSVACTGPDFIQSVLDEISNELEITTLNHEHFFPTWWCCDELRNKDYEEHKSNLDLDATALSAKYPGSISYHKGFTSKK